MRGESFDDTVRHFASPQEFLDISLAEAQANGVNMGLLMDTADAKATIIPYELPARRAMVTAIVARSMVQEARLSSSE